MQHHDKRGKRGHSCRHHKCYVPAQSKPSNIAKLRLVTAFSRQEGTPRHYVQDWVSELGEDVIKLSTEGASFYVCGRAAMAREVVKVVGATMQKAKDWTEDEVNS